MFSDFSPVTDLANLKDTLDKYGVAVLTNVFTPEECDTTRQKIFKYLEKEHDIVEPDDFEKLKPIQGGMLHNFGISLLPEILDMKTDERTVEPFRKIWNEQEMTTSLDGMFIGPPPELTTKRFYFERPTFHFDQASDKKEFSCVQAFIHLEETEHGDGCLSVLTKSHLYFNEFYEHFKIDTHSIDWYSIRPHHFDWFMQKGCEWNTILAPKGSMVLWDSRLCHCGTLPRRERPKPNWRFLVYVCYTPARLQTNEDAKLKREAYKQNRCTAHWPYSVRLFHRLDADLKFNS